MVSRRSFLTYAGAGMAAGSLLSSSAFAYHPVKIPLGIQLWTVKSETDKDVEGTLRKVYAAGFREIEFAGYYGKTPAELGKLMTDIGFTLVSTHANPGEIARKGDEIIRDAKALGLKHVICSSPMVAPDKDKLTWEQRMNAVDLADWKMNADLFNKFGRQVSEAGMAFGYHNHSAEFKKFDGISAFDYLFDNTDPEHVQIQLDVGWATVAGVDPVAILNKYRGRVVSVHVKDAVRRGGTGKDPTSVALGEGVIDWKKVLHTARATSVKHYFYEQDSSLRRPILDSVKMSADYLGKLDF